MVVDALVVVRLGVYSKKKIRQRRIREGLNVTLQWWNMTHLLENKSSQREQVISHIQMLIEREIRELEYEAVNSTARNLSGHINIAYKIPTLENVLSTLRRM